jgi:hypothetical protein
VPVHDPAVTGVPTVKSPLGWGRLARPLEPAVPVVPFPELPALPVPMPVGPPSFGPLIGLDVEQPNAAHQIVAMAMARPRVRPRM